MMCKMNIRNPKVSILWLCCTVFLTIAVQSTVFGVDAPSVIVDSPNGLIKVEIRTDSEGQLTWSVYRQEQLILAPAPLGLTVDGQDLGRSVTLGSPRKRTIDEQYPIRGNHAVAVNRCNEAVIPVKSAGGLNYELEVRAYDDGTAVRTRVALDEDTLYAVAGEATSWSLPSDSLVWWSDYDNSYEKPYQSGTYESIPANTPLAPPITFKTGNNLYIALTEANNDCFPDMGLIRQGAFIKAVFPPSSGGWKHKGTIVTPWRVAIIAEGLNALVNSDLVTNLCPPPSDELANADWIKPGRALWQWWSIGAPRLNDQKEWVDAAKHLGFEYYLIDDGWRRWRLPDKDQWQCLKEVIDYAKTQGVACLVWVDSSEMRTAEARRAYLEKVAALGAAGIKIDFVPPCTPEITRWYEGALKDTAELRLLCNFHGAVKLTGRQRTWPHELTREGVRGHEYHMTRYRRVQAADHDQIVLFTRYLAGPADYTPTAFDPREMVGYTWPHLLAQAVNMTSPLLHFAGKYQDFIGNPSEDLLRHLPSVWDETIVLPGTEIGKTAAFARRRGQEWYIGVLNGGTAVTLPIELSFLGPGQWQAELFGDQSDNPAAFKRESKLVKTGDKLVLPMSPRGGAVVWIRTSQNSKSEANSLPGIKPAPAATSGSFDADWRFLRADAPGAEVPGFDDSAWRRLDVPHDWSIEDLPPTDDHTPELHAAKGTWRFQKGDNPDWKAPQLDDSDWQEVVLPNIWERHSNYREDNVYGWFRRTIEIPDALKGSDFILLLGRIDDVDEVWFNGRRIGGSGSFPPAYQTAYDVERRYRVPASLVRGDGSDVLAVRVFDSSGEGGIYAAGINSVRIGPFDPGQSQGGTSTGYVVGGTGWYRKHFTVHETNKRMSVQFDGVYMNADFWINGVHLGHHPYGYTSFEFDLTSHLKPAGQNNVLAVRVRNEGKNSRWYSGSGIYRPVRLRIKEPVHVPMWGVFVTTPEVSGDKAQVKVSIEVLNAADTPANALVRARVCDADGTAINSTESRLDLPAGEMRTTERLIDVPRPKLWSPDAPYLYSAEVEILTDGKPVNAVSTNFGIRKIEIDAEHGFRLNGEPLLLKGGCVHHDNGPLGAAAIDRAEQRRVELLKANGFNAIRTSHNPPSTAFLDACDRLGMLVIDEAFDQWEQPKNGQDYHLYFNDWAERDIASMVRRDRNHPSVVIWSIGNEIPEQFRAEATAQRLRRAVLSHDPTRPITQGVCNDWGTVTRNWDRLSDPAFLHLDVAGYNYLPEKYVSDHARHPDRVMMGTESYPKDALNYWSLVEKHPYVIGDFVWTAMDYLGETGIGNRRLSNEPGSFLMPWPWFNAWCGDLDICGFKKAQSYYRDVVWRSSDIELLVHTPIPDGLTEVVSAWGWPEQSKSWTWPGHEGRPVKVSVYSRCDKVRLERNGRVIGEKPVSEATRLTAEFDVPYEAGELRAVGLIDGKVVAEAVLKTSGPPTAIRLTADRTEIRAARSDLAYVTVEVVDADGRIVPNADMPVRFSVSGVGELAAQASASPNEPASFHAPVRKTYQGRCLAILRPKDGAGTITLKAEADGLKAAQIVIVTQ